MKRRPFVAAALGVTMLISGCSAQWHRVPVGEGAQLQRRQRVQVYHDRKMDEWHAVRLSLDSISGVPFYQSPGCDSCRVSVPRPQVDSIRLGDPGEALLETVGIVALISLLLMIWACSQLGCEEQST